jgi:hypothetical protein
MHKRTGIRTLNDTVYALRDINKDEEIIIIYIGALKNRKAWRKAL